MSATITPIRTGAWESPATRLADPDSFACQVQAFLDCVQRLSGNAVEAHHFDGRELVRELVQRLAIEGDGARPQLTQTECVLVIRWLSALETRKNTDSFCDGGVANCGFNFVVSWVADQVEALVTA